MARIRYLKPSFFKDEDIKELPFKARLWYQGMWCLADREGRLEDRPEWLKIEILPYDKVNPEEMLSLLTKNKKNGRRPFILRYENNGEKYIQILQWHKHQKPHHTEKESVIPPPTSEQMELNGEITVNPPLDTYGEGKGNGEGKWNGKISFKEDIYIVVLDFWNSIEERGLARKHELKGEIGKDIKKAIDKLLEKKESIETIKQAIENYFKILSDEKYFFKYVWRLDQFLRQKNAYWVFKQDFDILHNNYLNKKPKESKWF